MKKRIPTTKPSKHIANQNVAGKTQHISSSGFTESSGSNLPPDPALKEWKQVGETKDTLITNPSRTNLAGVLFRQCAYESEGTASYQENRHSKEYIKYLFFWGDAFCRPDIKGLGFYTFQVKFTQYFF